jgi:hypothetical protein
VQRTIRDVGDGTTRVTVEFEPGEPVQGRLVDGRGAVQAFYGWLELSRALECAYELGEPTAGVVEGKDPPWVPEA